MKLQTRAAMTQPDFSSLQGRVAIVTGAGQGIGKVFAKAFAECGAIPVIAELDAAKGEAVAKEIVDSGGQAFAVATDVSSPDSIAAMVEAVERRYGRIDILVNNAGIFSTLEMRPSTRFRSTNGSGCCASMSPVHSCARARCCRQCGARNGGASFTWHPGP